MKFLWITDPWDTLDHPKDTTLRLAEEAIAQGHESHWADMHSLRSDNGRILLDVQRIQTIYPGREARSIHLEDAHAVSPGAYASIHYRTDPPIDLAYLHPLQLLTRGVGKSAEIVNPPAVLFSANEKFEAGELAPPGLVASARETLVRFLASEKRAVLKPLHEAQSKGVALLDASGEFEPALERATAGWTQPVILQRFLPGISEGEQRLWFLDGKLLAFARKVPAAGDFRVNMDRGGRLVHTTLSATDKKVAAKVSKLLRARKIRLAAVDLIEGFVTDFNFTSPGLLVQMEALLGENFSAKVISTLAE